METNNAEEDTLFNETGNYYLNNEKLHDVQFIVGEQKEKIGAVRIMLIGQSKTWWTMLSEDSSLAEKGDIYLPDIEPEVFTLLLKHSYGGLSNLDDLSDDTVMKLCYCANKYFMKSLFEKISIRLQPKDVKDLFPALHCMVYYNLKGVEESVKKMVQTQTTKILNNPEFLECDIDSVTYICKQDSLNCDELSLWKAVVKWAKHKAQSDEGAKLRQWMSDPLQHIRLTTLSVMDQRDHVFSIPVLSGEEIASICTGDLSSTRALCVEKTPRNLIVGKVVKKTVDVVQKITDPNYHYVRKSKSTITDSNYHYTSKSKSTSCFFIKDKNIQLQSLIVRGYANDYAYTDRKESWYFGYRTNTCITVKVTRITNTVNNTSDEEPVVIELKDISHCYSEKITVPTLVDEKGITLLANSKYKVELSSSLDLPCWKDPDCVDGHDFDDGTFHCSLVYNDGVGLSACHILQFTYGVAED